MNYDTMSVMSLLCAYAEWAMCGESDKRIGEEFVIIESALRNAVIREASVGTLVHACDFPAEDAVYMNNDEALPVADYWLIPKETKQPAMPKTETEAQHKMVDEFTKGVDKIMFDAINFRPDKETP